MILTASSSRRRAISRSAALGRCALPFFSLFLIASEDSLERDHHDFYTSGDVAKTLQATWRIHHPPR